MLAGSTLPVSLLAVAQAVRCCFTAPSFEVFTHLLAGMVVTRGPRTVTGMLTGAGLSRSWSHHRAHRFFSRAAWDPRKVGLALAGAVIDALIPAGAPVRVAVDDTLLRRRGKKVWAALWTHDGSARSQDKIGYGNTWVVLAILVDLPPRRATPEGLPPSPVQHHITKLYLHRAPLRVRDTMRRPPRPGMAARRPHRPRQPHVLLYWYLGQSHRITDRRNLVGRELTCTDSARRPSWPWPRSGVRLLCAPSWPVSGQPSVG